MALALVGLVLVTVAVGALLVSGVASTGPHAVTIPVADRNASPALLREAEAVGFHPHTIAGAGVVEDDPLLGAMPSPSASLLPTGSTAPQFSLRTPTGVPVSLRSLRGRAVLIEFFATWCPHCDAEAPHLQQLYSSLPPREFSVVAVNADGETAPSVLAYHIYFGLGFPALLDPSSHPGSFAHPGSRGSVSRAYRVRVFPTFYVLDRAGRVVWTGSGEQPDAVLRHELGDAR